MSTTSAPIDIALAYHHAWIAGGMDMALKHVDENVVCDAPAGRLIGAAALNDYMAPFASMLTSARLLASYGDESRALIMYDTATPPVPSAPAAELYDVEDGRITGIRLIFDRLPFALARGEVVRLGA